jgi:hypothetical protein
VLSKDKRRTEFEIFVEDIFRESFRRIQISDTNYSMEVLNRRQLTDIPRTYDADQ